jgi:hypothetical protein
MAIERTSTRQPTKTRLSRAFAAVLAGMLAAPPASAGADPDGDGFTVGTGDCCESQADGCTVPAAVNPAAFEFAGNGLDDDCDGAVDDVDAACTETFAIDDANANNGAAAIGVCRFAQNAQDWGIVSATYTRSNGTPSNALGLHRGLLPDFGPNLAPFSGARMLALSSGFARDAGDPGGCGTTSCSALGVGTPPGGFPQDVPGCPSPSPGVGDDPALSLSLRAPSNATGFRLRYRFYSHEWPEFACTAFNDQMLVLMDPAPPGSIAGNLAFDAQSRPVGVAHAGITVCDPNDVAQYPGTPPDPYCPDGTADLSGTGFATSAGAMKWQLVQAPVSGLQAFSLRLTIFDVGDTAFDSTALFDGFEWIIAASRTVALFQDGFEAP